MFIELDNIVPKHRKFYEFCYRIIELSFNFTLSNERFKESIN